MSSFINAFLKIVLIIFLFTPSYFSQSIEDLQSFFEKNSNFILKRAHNNSELIKSLIKVETSLEEDYEFKIVIDLNYKGFIKQHNLKCYIYFEGEPLKFVWGEDSNWFKIKTDSEVILEELKELWQDWSINY